MNKKPNKLEKLNRPLKPPRELSGVFLPSDSKKQFDFMFIAEMPSMNAPKNWDGKSNYNFDVTKRDEFFQEVMRDNCVAGSYATDIVKEVNKPGRPTPAKIKKWRPHLLEEIKIIQPKAIIVLGKTNYQINFEPFVEPSIPKGIKVGWTFHYSSRVSRNKFKRRFKEVISKMR